MKNLVVVHLESVSNELMTRFEKSLTFIRDIQNKSKSYSSFVSVATSTMMVKASFFTGSDDFFDKYTDFNFKDYLKNKQNNHLFELLKNKGLVTSHFVYPDCWIVDKERTNRWGIWNESAGDIEYFSSRESYYESLKKSCSAEAPWAIYLHPLLSHLAYSDEQKSKAENSWEYLAFGFDFLDKMVENLYHHLEKTGQLEETIWVFYGDHGDALFTKSFNGGMCHGSEPYLPMVSCPLFIYNSAYGIAETCDDLITTSDCKSIILNELGIDTLLPRQRDVVFSQNQFINQFPGVMLNKAFMAYNGKYLLMVSYLGLEMYDCRVDPENNNNLLSFFKMTPDGTLGKNQNLFDNAHPHFKRIYGKKYIAELSSNFIVLKGQLKEWICCKENSVADVLVAAFPDRNFSKIRKRKYYWRYSATCLESWVRDWKGNALLRLGFILGRISNFLSIKMKQFCRRC